MSNKESSCSSLSIDTPNFNLPIPEEKPKLIITDFSYNKMINRKLIYN